MSSICYVQPSAVSCLSCGNNATRSSLESESYLRLPWVANFCQLRTKLRVAIRQPMLWYETDTECYMLMGIYFLEEISSMHEVGKETAVNGKFPYYFP